MTTATNIIRYYMNGNYVVELCEDGTKRRIAQDGNLIPEFPESIDIKITNHCDLFCEYCHEKSYFNYEFCDINSLIDKLSGLPEGVELAIGGGNPLDHPQLFELFGQLKDRGFVANITVNEKHLINGSSNGMRLATLINNGFVYGIGISIIPYTNTFNVENFFDTYCHHFRQNSINNVVAHVIAGVHPFLQIADIVERYGKVLILGYKQVGRGINFYDREVVEKIDILRNNLWRFLKHDAIISFDNLAIEQLHIRNFFKQKEWDEFYMGDDGTFSMYYDAVTQQAAPSSISHREDIGDNTLSYYFKQLRNR